MKYVFWIFLNHVLKANGRLKKHTLKIIISFKKWKSSPITITISAINLQNYMFIEILYVFSENKYFAFKPTLIYKNKHLILSLCG